MKQEHQPRIRGLAPILGRNHYVHRSPSWFPPKNQYFGAARDLARYRGGSGIAGTKGWYSCHCVAHDDQRASLALRDTPRGLMVKCFAGCEPLRIKAAFVQLQLSGALSGPLPPLPATENVEVDLMNIAAGIWHGAIEEALTERYLRGRCITVMSDALRGHSAVYHKETRVTAPAMIALVKDVAGEPGAIHRTWLDLETGGKAKFDPVRKSLCPVKGRAVHLFEAVGDILYVSEGIENALSYIQYCSMAGHPVTGPVWAALSAPGIASLQVPDRIKEVRVILDRDEACFKAVNQLSLRLHRQHVSVSGPPLTEGTPPFPINDFNDALRLVSGAPA
jgi:hypothetical protein